MQKLVEQLELTKEVEYPEELTFKKVKLALPKFPLNLASAEEGLEKESIRILLNVPNADPEDWML